jgi:transcriptional regulator with XRE-family HTH domain
MPQDRLFDFELERSLKPQKSAVTSLKFGPRGLSQAELGERAGPQRQQITYYETGAPTPSVANLLRIARPLDVSLERLLWGNDRPGEGVRDSAIELRSLGLGDLWVEAPVVAG